MGFPQKNQRGEQHYLLSTQAVMSNYKTLPIRWYEVEKAQKRNKRRQKIMATLSKRSPLLFHSEKSAHPWVCERVISLFLVSLQTACHLSTTWWKSTKKKSNIRQRKESTTCWHCVRARNRRIHYTTQRKPQKTSLATVFFFFSHNCKNRKAKTSLKPRHLIPLHARADFYSKSERVNN